MLLCIKMRILFGRPRDRPPARFLSFYSCCCYCIIIILCKLMFTPSFAFAISTQPLLSSSLFAIERGRSWKLSQSIFVIVNSCAVWLTNRKWILFAFRGFLNSNLYLLVDFNFKTALFVTFSVVIKPAIYRTIADRWLFNIFIDQLDPVSAVIFDLLERFFKFSFYRTDVARKIVMNMLLSLIAILTLMKPIKKKKRYCID